MANSGPLVPFGIAVAIVAGLLIIVPFMRGKSDLLTGWNCLLLGLILFTAAGSIEVNVEPVIAWEQLEWFQPTAKEVQWYMWATSAFIAALVAAYYFNTPATNFARRRLQKWPPITLPVTFLIIGFFLASVVISSAVMRVTFIGPIMFKLGYKGTVFATVFSFMLWYRNRANLNWLCLFLGVLGTALLYAMLVSPGRRLMMSMFLGPMLCVYWVHVRYWKPKNIIIAMAIAGSLMLGITTAYSRIRWYNFSQGEKRSVAGIVSQLRDLRSGGDVFSTLVKGKLSYFGQQNGHDALLTQRLVAQGVLTPKPLNSLAFLAAYAVPRNVWRSKPDVLGLTIVRDTLHIPGTNWGLGIAGQGAYEGGIAALVLYGVLLAFFARIMDEPLRMQPTNPFLISIHAGALPNVVGIARGDMAIMFSDAAEYVAFAFLLGVICRIIFGTRKLPIASSATRTAVRSISRPSPLTGLPHNQ